MPEEGFFKWGKHPETTDNPWKGAALNAPFDKEVYITMNLAIGGTNGYFPDGMAGKPWSNGDQHSVNGFWNAKPQWSQTWKGEDAALQVDYVVIQDKANRDP